MRKILFIALALLCASAAFGQDKKVAMLEPLVKGGAVTKIEKEIILAALETAITGTPGYKAFTRVDVNQITKEVSFQQSGMVNAAQRKRIGQLSGASLICISQLTAGENIHIKSSLVDVETGEIVNVANQLMKKDETALFEGCQTLAAAMLGVESSGNSLPSRDNNSSDTGAPANGAVYNPDGIELVYVEGMGSGSWAIQGFFIGKYEVTQEQYEAIMGVNPSWYRGSNHPVEEVSWYDAQEFITKLNARTGRNYRLPTEAEWEYAAHGGNHSIKYLYSGSNNVDLVAWYSDTGVMSTHGVGEKLPNALGLYDMSGNVREWCISEVQSDPSMAPTRGGSASFHHDYCKISYRWLMEKTWEHGNGVRVVCDLK
jgi:hypothetical protein